MRNWLPFLAGVLVYVAILAFLGGMHVASIYKPDADWGPIEFFINRYQGLIAAGTALLAAWFAWLQIREQRDIQTRVMMLQYRREMDALYTAMEMAVHVRETLEKGELPDNIDPGISNTVVLHASPRVSRAMELLSAGAARVRQEDTPFMRATLRRAADLLEQTAQIEYRDIGNLISSVEDD